MDRYKYEINFIGHLCIDQTLQADGSWSRTFGGAALYGAIAAASLDRRIAVELKLSQADTDAVDLLKRRGIDVFTIPATETTSVEVSHPTGNVDERRAVTTGYAGIFDVEQIRDVSAAHVHLAGCNDHEFPLELIRAVRRTAPSLSIDMQCFVRFNDPDSGEMIFAADPTGREAIGLMDKVKLDILEARLLCGTDDLERAADTVQRWGCDEVMITRADGVFVRCGRESHFERFTNKGVAGRTGRGDTTFGAYLAARVDQDPPEALKYAAALVSLKMEQPGPFAGTRRDVLARIEEAYS